MRDEQVERSIAVEVRRDDGSCRFGRDRYAVRKVTLAVIEADETRSGDFVAFAGFAFHGVQIVAAVGDHNIRIAVAVQVSQGHIPRSPVRAAEGAGLGEVSFAVIQEDKLGIRCIVAGDNVQVAVARCVRALRNTPSVAKAAQAAH